MAETEKVRVEFVNRLPALITFDIFGTVLDWRSGLESACAAAGRPLRSGEFDRIVDVQAKLEQGEFLTYAEITQRSLIDAIGMSDRDAVAIGQRVGEWPLYADSRAALEALSGIVPCAAMTNSDRVHGDQVHRQLGFRLADWLCAEETRVYKPSPKFWQLMARRRNIELDSRWWHVSAYADYDLAVANSLGLTTVFVKRPHARPGAAAYAVDDLMGIPPLLRAGT